LADTKTNWQVSLLEKTKLLSSQQSKLESYSTMQIEYNSLTKVVVESQAQVAKLQKVVEALREKEQEAQRRILVLEEEKLSLQYDLAKVTETA